MPPRKAELALYLLPKHHVLHEVVYNFKKKDQAMLCRSNTIKICFGDHSVSYGRPWSRKERKRSIPPDPCPRHPQLLALGMLLLLTCTISAATGFRQAANGIGSQRRPSRQAAACFYRTAAFSSLLSQEGQLEVAHHLHSERKNLILSSESCGEISSKLSPGTRLLDTNLSPVTSWRLQHKPS